MQTSSGDHQPHGDKASLGRGDGGSEEDADADEGTANAPSKIRLRNFWKHKSDNIDGKMHAPTMDQISLQWVVNDELEGTEETRTMQRGAIFVAAVMCRMLRGIVPLGIYVRGMAGTGKTEVTVRVITQLFEANGYAAHRVAVTAPTNQSAKNADTEHTIYKWAALDLGKESAEVIIAKLEGKAGRKRARYYRAARGRIIAAYVLVIDEFPMLSKELLEKLDKIFRAIRGCDEQFGGICMIGIGDDTQLGPVVDDVTARRYKSQDEAQESQWFFCYDGLSFGNYIEFHEQYRLEDADLLQVAHELREGGKTITPAGTDIIRGRLRGVAGLFPDADTMYVLCTHLETDRVNETRYEEVRQKDPAAREEFYEVIAYASTGTGEENAIVACDDLPEGSAKELLKEGVAMLGIRTETVRVSVGVKYMLTKKITVVDRETNGKISLLPMTICHCVAFEVDVLPGHGINDVNVARTDVYPVMEADGVQFVVSPQVTEVGTDARYGSLYVVHQPMRVGYAATVHVTQSCTILSKLAVDLGSLFTSGQAYTAWTRVRRLEQIIVLRFDPTRIYLSKAVQKFLVEEFHPTCARQEQETKAWLQVQRRSAKVQQANRYYMECLRGLQDWWRLLKMYLQHAPQVMEEGCDVHAFALRPVNTDMGGTDGMSANITLPDGDSTFGRKIASQTGVGVAAHSGKPHFMIGDGEKYVSRIQFKIGTDNSGGSLSVTCLASMTPTYVVGTKSTVSLVGGESTQAHVGDIIRVRKGKDGYVELILWDMNELVAIGRTMGIERVSAKTGQRGTKNKKHESQEQDSSQESTQSSTQPLTSDEETGHKHKRPMQEDSESDMERPEIDTSIGNAHMLRPGIGELTSAGDVHHTPPNAMQIQARRNNAHATTAKRRRRTRVVGDVELTPTKRHSETNQREEDAKVQRKH